jgi:hypothetical protein
MSNPVTPLTPAQVVTNESQTAAEGYIHRAFVAVDIAASELAGGPMDETISTRLAIDSVEAHGLSKEIGKFGSAILDKFQSDHGADAAAGDLERAQSEENIVSKSGLAP